MSLEDRGTGDAELAAEIAVLEDMPQRGRVVQGLLWLRELQSRRAATAPDRGRVRAVVDGAIRGMARYPSGHQVLLDCSISAIADRVADQLCAPAPKPHHAGRQAIPVINPADTPELREAISKLKADGHVKLYTGDPSWHSRVHAAADKIDRGASIDDHAQDQTSKDLNRELIAKCDAAVFLGDSPGVRAARAANTLPVIPIRTPVELVLAKLEAAAKAATAGKWDSPKEGPGSRHHAVVSDAGPLWDEGYGGQLIGESFSPANGAYVVATQPAEILALIATVREMIPLVKDWATMQQTAANRLGISDSDFDQILNRALFVEVP
jgi:hypothetical protein